jgi:hypothetical protein
MKPGLWLKPPGARGAAAHCITIAGSLALLLVPGCAHRASVPRGSLANTYRDALHEARAAGAPTTPQTLQLHPPPDDRNAAIVYAELRTGVTTTESVLSISANREGPNRLHLFTPLS